MPVYFLTTALFVVSVATNLTVEGVKKILNTTTVNYSSNLLASIVSMLLACAVCIVYLVMNDIVFSMKIGVEVAILMYLSFLVSTVGYDKVIQMVKQIKGIKEEQS